MIVSSTYVHLSELLDFIAAPNVLEILHGASRGVSPRASVAADVNDEAVIDAVCRLLADNIVDDVRLLHKDLLFGVLRITDRGRLIHHAIEQLLPPPRNERCDVNRACPSASILVSRSGRTRSNQV